MAEAFNTRQSCFSPGLHFDGCRRIVRVWNRHVINREILRRFAETGAVISRISVPVDQELRHYRFRLSWGRIGIDKVLIANDEDALRQAGCGLLGAFDSFYDQSTGGSSEQLLFTESVDMRVIPVEARRLVRGYAKAILKGRIPRLHRRLQDIILMAYRGNRKTVKVEVGRHRAHDSAGTRIGSRMSMRVCGHGCTVPAAYFCQLIGEMKNDQIARMHTQVRRFVSF